MPSLNTNNDNCRLGTYHFIVSAVLQDISIKQNINKLWFMIQIKIQFAFFIVVVALIYYTTDSLYYYKINFYQKYWWYCIANEFYFGFGLFVVYLFLIVYLSGLYKISRKIKCIHITVCIFIYIIFNGSCSFFIVQIYHSNSKVNNLFYPLLHQMLWDIDCEKTSRLWINCNDSTLQLYHFYFSFVLTFALPFIHCLMLYFVYTVLHCKQRNRISIQSSTSDNKMESSESLRISLNSTPTVQNIINDIDCNVMNEKNKNENKNTNITSIRIGTNKKCDSKMNNIIVSSSKNNNYYGQFEAEYAIIKYLLCYLLIWMIFGLIYTVIAALQPRFIFEKNWDSFYYSWVILTTIIKFALKKYARKIDRNKIKLYYLIKMNGNISNNNGKQSTIDSYFYSFEWFTEALMSMIYWLFYRNDITWYFIQIGWSWSLSIILITHFVSEFIESTLRLTDIYYNYTRRAIEYWYSLDDLSIFQSTCCCNVCNDTCKCKCQCMSSFKMWTNRRMYDDSRLNEWRTRASIDILIRFSVSSVSAFTQMINILTLGKSRNGSKSWYNLDDKTMWIAFEITIIAWLSEFVYFIVAFCICYYCWNIDIIDHFSKVWKVYKPWFQTSYIVICFILVVMTKSF